MGGTKERLPLLVDQGVTIFRVDNPHTKAFPFWEWVITEIKRAHPEVLFLAEAFTRPKIMYRLAKLVQPILYVFPLAQREGRNHRLSHRAHTAARARLLPPQPVAQHA